MMKRLLRSTICVGLLFNGCILGCTSDGKGWQVEVRTGGFSIKYETLNKEDGDYGFTQTFDPEGVSLVKPFLVPKEKEDAESKSETQP